MMDVVVPRTIEPLPAIMTILVGGGDFGSAIANRVSERVKNYDQYPAEIMSIITTPDWPKTDEIKKFFEECTRPEKIALLQEKGFSFAEREVAGSIPKQMIWVMEETENTRNQFLQIQSLFKDLNCGSIDLITVLKLKETKEIPNYLLDGDDYCSRHASYFIATEWDKGATATPEDLIEVVVQALYLTILPSQTPFLRVPITHQLRVLGTFGTASESFFAEFVRDRMTSGLSSDVLRVSLLNTEELTGFPQEISPSLTLLTQLDQPILWNDMLRNVPANVVKMEKVSRVSILAEKVHVELDQIRYLKWEEKITEFDGVMGHTRVPHWMIEIRQNAQLLENQLNEKIDREMDYLMNNWRTGINWMRNYIEQLNILLGQLEEKSKIVRDVQANIDTAKDNLIKAINNYPNTWSFITRLSGLSLILVYIFYFITLGNSSAQDFSRWVAFILLSVVVVGFIGYRGFIFLSDRKKQLYDARSNYMSAVCQKYETAVQNEMSRLLLHIVKRMKIRVDTAQQQIHQLLNQAKLLLTELDTEFAQEITPKSVLNESVVKTSDDIRFVYEMQNYEFNQIAEEVIRKGVFKNWRNDTKDTLKTTLTPPVNQTVQTHSKIILLKDYLLGRYKEGTQEFLKEHLNKLAQKLELSYPFHKKGFPVNFIKETYLIFPPMFVEEGHLIQWLNKKIDIEKRNIHFESRQTIMLGRLGWVLPDDSGTISPQSKSKDTAVK